MTALELIKWRLARREAIHLMFKDERAKRLLIAWTCYKPPISDFVISEKQDPEGARRRLWEELGPLDWQRLADLSDLPATKVPKLFYRLKEANLLWPDGTLNEFADTLLRAEAGAYISSLAPSTKIYGQSRADSSRSSIPEQNLQRLSKGRSAAPRANKVRRRTLSRSTRIP